MRLPKPKAELWLLLDVSGPVVLGPDGVSDFDATARHYALDGGWPMNEFIRIDPLVAGQKGQGTIMDTKEFPWR
jgi:hypothetical protein